MTGERPPGDVAVVVPAAGAGVRLGAGPPKALRLLRGEPLLSHAVRRLLAATSVGQVVVAAPPGQEEAARRRLDPSVLVVTGGTDRQRSVAIALAEVPAEFEVVLVHDAARALTPASLVDDVADMVRAGHDAVIPVLPVVDTVVRVAAGGEVREGLDRSELRAVQTPQGFRRSVLVKAHAAAAADGTTATDDAGLVARLGVPVRTVIGSDLALKITTKRDLTVAEALLAQI